MMQGLPHDASKWANQQSQTEAINQLKVIIVDQFINK